MIRNPVAVRESLGHRASEGMGPVQLPADWEALWRRYNEALLAEYKLGAFPIVDFDRVDDIDGQVRAASAHTASSRWGSPPRSTIRWSALGAGEGWRDDADPASLELWDRLQELAASGPSGNAV